MLAPAVFALLVLATVAAFAVAQRVKREPLVLDKVELSPVFTPNGDGRGDRARIVFRLTRSGRGDVEIIDRSDRPVRALAVDVLNKRGRVAQTLGPGSTLPSYKPLVSVWNGRDNAGRPAPTGPYRLRVTLFDQDRTLVPLGRIRLHTLQRVAGQGQRG